MTDVLVSVPDELWRDWVAEGDAIDPEAVMIGGAMTFGGERAPVGRAFLERVRAEVRRRTFPTLAEKTVIGYASLGGDAGSIGAAGLARLAAGKR